MPVRQINNNNNSNMHVVIMTRVAINFSYVQRIYIPLPEAPARSHMFKVHLGDTPNSLTQRDFDELGKLTAGFSGSDVNVVVKDVLFEPVRKTQEATHFR